MTRRPRFPNTLEYMVLPDVIKDGQIGYVKPAKHKEGEFNDTQPVKIVEFDGDLAELREFIDTPAGLFQILMRRTNGPVLLLINGAGMAVNVWPRYNAN